MAVVYVTINVLVQTRGDKNLALAIVTNLPLGSLAMVVLLSASSLFLIGMLLAGPTVALDSTYTAPVRRFFSILTLACALMHALTASLVFSLVFLGFAYINWRLSVTSRERLISFDQWLDHKAGPEDAGLYEIWIKARALSQSAEGAACENVEKLSRLKREMRDRHRAIRGAAQPDFRNAVYRSGSILISTYGLMLLTTPVQLGPTEIVQFKSGPSVTGYVLIANEDRGIVFDPKSRTAKSIVASDISRRLVCTRHPGWSSLTLGDLDRLDQFSWDSRETCA
ncbi:hypothetical protein [Arthrobacter sp. NPDC057013]|uniref:hypothetical protein n=1 Tax=Arthrobacter sp. NPDC057013 TaxID=3345999 RepID=UPI003642FBC1